MHAATPYPKFSTEWLTIAPKEGSLRREGDRWVFSAWVVGENREAEFDLFDCFHFKPIKDEVIEACQTSGKK